MIFFSCDAMMYFFLASTMVSMIRVVRGPSPVDRMIGLNLVSAQTLAILVLVAVNKQLAVYLDVAMVYAIFGFVGMLAITKYFSRQDAPSNPDQSNGTK